MPANPLEWLGAIMPKAPRVSERQREMHKKKTHEEVMEDRRQHPTKAMINDTLAALGELTGGFIGTSGKDDSYLGGVGELAGAASDVIPSKLAAKKVVTTLAGLPFLHYVKTGAVPKGHLVHASKTPEKLMPHGVIDPDRLRAGAQGKGLYTSPDTDLTNRFWEGLQEEGMPERGMSLPVVPEAKNVLDLVNPDPRDLHEVMRAMHPESQKRYMEYFNKLMGGETHEGKRFTNKEAYAELGKIMGLGESDATRAGFDAVRYPYEKGEAWMIPNTTPMKTPHGVPLNEAAGGIRTGPTPDLEVSGPTRRPPIPRSRGARAAASAAPTMQAQSPSTLSSAVSITPGVTSTPIPTAPSTPVTPPVLSSGQQPPRLVKPEKKMSVAELMSTPSALTPEQEAAKKKLMEDIKRRMNK